MNCRVLKNKYGYYWCHIDTTPKAGLFIQLFVFLQSLNDLNFSRSVLTNL